MTSVAHGPNLVHPTQITTNPVRAAPTHRLLNLDTIIVGSRSRQDMGDVAPLAASIVELGLLHPIVVTPDNRLIAGARRIAAYRQLGYPEIPATVIELDCVVRGEYAENYLRKSFSPSEMVHIFDALEPILRAEASERKHSGKGQNDSGGRGKKKPPEKFSEGFSGNALDHVAKCAGAHRTTMVKIRAVHDAANADPKRFGKLLDEMDRTGRVDGPYRRLKAQTQAAAIRAEPPPYPSGGPYRVIVADPPWPYEVRIGDRRGIQPYPTMTIAEICAQARQVNDIAHEDCVLWLWTTNHHMREAFEVLDAWGFRQKTILTWAKTRMGTGDWLRRQTEHCLMAARGKPVVELTNQTTLLHAAVKNHSQKPEEFYELVERLCPAPRYVNLFSQSARVNWDAHGDEAPPHSNDSAQPEEP